MSDGVPGDYLFRGDLESIDPDIHNLIQLEEERQSRRIILIPSESTSPLAVRQALGSVFSHVYAEGYPPLRMTKEDEALLLDYPYQLAYYRRYADRRFYKGTDYAHFAETICQRRVAQCFATDKVPADQIFVNVQPLSGAAANNSVYDAFVQPGDTVMGMSLMHGGHLTHGSEFNRSGKNYRIVSYAVDPRTERLDYDAIQALALEHRPKMIIAGYTSYPWAPDWQRFREIADSVGAILMADIAHTAGMAIAGAYPSPVGLADVVSFTTHKTLCGPRAAVIITTDESNAQKIDSAVFPGEQGGPHVHKFVALAVAFKLAQTAQFRALQHQIVRNAALADAFTKRGIRLAYNGTDTHLMLLDLKSVKSTTGFPLRGEIAARILELAGIVVNKNTIPGDLVTPLAMGIRIGTPWVTQRGMGTEDMDRIADLITTVIKGIHPFSYAGLSSELSRGKIDLDVLDAVAKSVDALTARFEPAAKRHDGYPHFPAQDAELAPMALPARAAPGALQQALDSGAAAVNLTHFSVIRVKGFRAAPFLQELATADLSGLDAGQSSYTYFLDRESKLLAQGTVVRLPADDRGRDQVLLIVPPDKAGKLERWMRGISDGYVLFDDADVMRKVQGPVTIEDLSADTCCERMVALGVYGAKAADVVGKALGVPPVADGACRSVTVEGAGVLVARPSRLGSLQGHMLVASAESAAGIWNRLASAGAVTCDPSALPVVRERFGFPGKDAVVDGAALLQSDPALFALNKPYFVGQSALKATGLAALPAFAWTEPANPPLLRTPLYDTHARLTRKIIPFAGWEMPVWYTSVTEEHEAVRNAAGLFDVAHMGVLEVSGPHAADFLDLVSSNYVRWLEIGQSQYGYLLDPDANVIDDIYVYRRGIDKYMVVVNAANADKDWAWLTAVNEGRVMIDRASPSRRLPRPAVLRNLKSPECGPECRVDLALQGPNSARALQALAQDPTTAARIACIGHNELAELTLADMSVIVSRTGYTGEPVGFELFVHPDQAVKLWSTLLERGASLGVKPAGLAARDSTRIEAGLPLYGHELDGAHNVIPSEAGFTAYVKYHKPFFVGRDAILAKDRASTMVIARFRANAPGTRAFRGHEPVINKRGQYIGRVTSCTAIGGYQMGMAYVDKRYATPGAEIAIYPVTDRDPAPKALETLTIGDKVSVFEWCSILTRFRTLNAAPKPPSGE